MRIFLLLLFICSGCVFCETPYIKSGDSCCLDENNDSKCDTVDVPVISPDTEPADLFHAAADDVGVQTTKLRPFELDFYISTAQYAQLSSVRFNATPKCAENHDLYLFVNDKSYGTVAIRCGEPFVIDIKADDVKEGQNKIGFISPDAPFLMDNVQISQKGSNVIQDMGEWVLEARRNTINLAREQDVVLQNYYELEFEIDDEVYVDITFAIVPDGDWEYQVYLNGEFLEKAQGIQNITLPKSRLLPGKNIVMYALAER